MRMILILTERTKLVKYQSETKGGTYRTVAWWNYYASSEKEINSKKSRQDEIARKNLIQAAKNGDEDAIESLTIEDIDTYNELSNRVMKEDIFTIVDSTFMPCGVECDQYSVIGEILELREEENIYTGEKIYIMVLECNSLIITTTVNKEHLLGEPAVGRRFKGQIWLQGNVRFTD